MRSLLGFLRGFDWLGCVENVRVLIGRSCWLRLRAGVSAAGFSIFPSIHGEMPIATGVRAESKTESTRATQKPNPPFDIEHHRAALSVHSIVGAAGLTGAIAVVIVSKVLMLGAAHRGIVRSCQLLSATDIVINGGGPSLFNSIIPGPIRKRYDKVHHVIVGWHNRISRGPLADQLGDLWIHIAALSNAFSLAQLSTVQSIGASL